MSAAARRIPPIFLFCLCQLGQLHPEIRAILALIQRSATQVVLIASRSAKRTHLILRGIPQKCEDRLLSRATILAQRRLEQFCPSREDFFSHLTNSANCSAVSLPSLRAFMVSLARSPCRENRPTSLFVFSEGCFKKLLTTPEEVAC